MDEQVVLKFRMRDHGLEALSHRLGSAVQKSEFIRSQTRWRRLSFVTAALYCCLVVLAANNNLIDLLASLSAAFCGYCSAVPRLGRFAGTS